MLRINDLRFSYDKHRVLNDLSLSIPKGSIHGILGVNGAGKTSFFKCLYGMNKPEGGSMTWNEMSLNFRQIAFLETSNFFYSNITGKEYLQLCMASSKAFPITEWNKIFQIPLNLLVDTYSTGMKKQLAFMGVLAQNRPILILDEPFNGLDFESTEKIHFILQRLRAHKTILISSHILETLTRNCNQISHLSNGQILRTYETTEFEAMATELRAQFQDRINEELDSLL